MNKFSIAPWKTEQSFCDVDYIRYIRDAQGEHIAHVCDLDDGVANDYADQALANARLMAAAPDLLAACIEALSLFDDYPECYESAGTLERLTTAIARATGDQTITA